MEIRGLNDPVFESASRADRENGFSQKLSEIVQL